MTVGRVMLYGDFNCPWSYLASRRAAVLAADGMQIDWRAVEHEPTRPRRYADNSDRFACLVEEMDKVVAELLAGEVLPYSLAGFLPRTRAALSGYAEAYAAGVATQVRPLLFEAFWMHGFDLGDARIVRTLLVDAIRSGRSPSEPLREWGYAVDVSGGPVSTSAWRLVAAWDDQWRDAGKEIVPVLLVDGSAPLFGVDAVHWLGAELLSRGLESHPVPRPAGPTARPTTDLAPLSWVAQNGSRWMRDYQRAHRKPLFALSG